MGVGLRRVLRDGWVSCRVIWVRVSARVRVRVRVRVMVRVMARVRSGSRGSCRARDWEARGSCRVRGEVQHLRLVGSGHVSARDSCRARE